MPGLVSPSNWVPSTFASTRVAEWDPRILTPLAEAQTPSGCLAFVGGPPRLKRVLQNRCRGVLAPDRSISRNSTLS